MDTGLEDLELRESQREYLDFLDDDVNSFLFVLILCGSVGLCKPHCNLCIE